MKVLKAHYIIQAAKNFVWSSLNLRCLQIWYLKSPPPSKSITRYKFSRSWNANLILTMESLWIFDSKFLSFKTEFTLLLRQNSLFRHFLHSKLLSWSFFLNLPDPAEAAFANNVHSQKLIFSCYLTGYLVWIPIIFEWTISHIWFYYTTFKFYGHIWGFGVLGFWGWSFMTS